MSKLAEVAKAIAERSHAGECCVEDLARAAIEALREPTPEMEAAGDDLDGWGPDFGKASALAHWTAMIDEALK